MNNENVKNDRSKFILGSQYFIYFGVLGVFLPYFNLYCYHLGFNGSQIGILSALRTGATVLFPLLWGVMADRFHARKQIYVLCNLISSTIWALFLYTTDFRQMVIISLFYGMFYSPIISFLEAFSMDILGKEKKSYGKIRAWGTVHFILISSLLGKIIDIFSINIIISLIFAGSIAQSFLSFCIPAITVEKKESFSSVAKTLLNTPIIVFLICAFMMLLSHGAYYGFFSIHLENLGYGNTFIGFAWALASVAEILVMINSGRIFKRFSLENVFIFSFAVAVIRWLILYFAIHPALILFSQILHAATYGTFHMASILYIDRVFPDRAKTFGQAVNNAITYGVGLTAGFILSGFLYEHYASHLLFFMSSLVAFAGGISMCFLKKNK